MAPASTASVCAGWPAQLERAARAVETTCSAAPIQPDFRNALQTQKVCDAVLRSAAKGGWEETGVEG